MGSQPGVGSVVIARYPHRLRAATIGRPVIDIPAGSRLEIVRLDERWDNTHAMIVRDYRISLDLRLLTGASASEMVTVTLTGSVATDVGQGTPEHLPLPDWLVLAPTPVFC